MNLRCRVGDLAIVVYTAPDERRQFLGRIVRIVGPGRNPCSWETAPRLMLGDLTVWADDDCLRPIRPDADPVDVGEPAEAAA